MQTATKLQINCLPNNQFWQKAVKKKKNAYFSMFSTTTAHEIERNTDPSQVMMP